MHTHQCTTEDTETHERCVSNASSVVSCHTGVMCIRTIRMGELVCMRYILRLPHLLCCSRTGTVPTSSLPNSPRCKRIGYPPWLLVHAINPAVKRG